MSEPAASQDAHDARVQATNRQDERQDARTGPPDDGFGEPPLSEAALMERLARPGRAYQRQTWIALLALLCFLTLYLALAGWFAWTAFELTIGGGLGQDALWGWLGGLGAAFLSALMFRALFFVKRGGTDRLLELRPQDQPALFDFLHRLADKAGAPRPHKVFLSADVNASVFYDLRLLNLLIPSRKNLLIGLGLVQALNLGEFRAVLAHEFGHFGQRAMAVGRWVYVAQQIARHLVVHRGKLDELLQRVSHWDLRIAWLGWGLRLVVWSIRCVVESAYRAVDLLQRALSREMEMNADLVAVALTGSDALIHALYRLQAADDAWSRALTFAMGEKQAGRRVDDLFALQEKVQQRLGSLLQQPDHGQPPPLPEDPAGHRIFRPQMAQPPRMWQSHPPSHEREDNAKRQYIHAPIDDRPAWDLFQDAAALRVQVTALALRAQEAPAAGSSQEAAQDAAQDPAARGEPAPLPPDESLQRLQQQFEREHLDPRYRGIHFGRSPVRHTADAQALWQDCPDFERSQLADLYPARLSEDMARLTALETELGQLLALERGHLEAQGGVIRFRDQTLKRKTLPVALQQVQAELQALRESLRLQDLRVRSLHLAVAEHLGQGWPEHLRGLITALHYGSHGEANLRDLQGILQHTFRQTTATGRVNDAGRQRIVDAAGALQQAMHKLNQEASLVKLDAVLAEALHIEQWRDAIGELQLPWPTAQNLGDWLNVIDGWVDQQANACGALRREALERLLLTEKRLVRQWLSEINPGAAPGRSQFPPTPDVLLEGQERPRDFRQSLWVRFQTADGWLPATARLGVAGGIVVSVLGLGGLAMQAPVSLYNGLDRAVVVSLSNGETLTLAPGEHRLTKAPAHRGLGVETRTAERALIERFEAPVSGAFEHHVYSVAAAAAMIEWTAVYGGGTPPPPTRVGASRWRVSEARHVFEQPPQSIRTKGGGESRLVLEAVPVKQVMAQLEVLPRNEKPEGLIQAHARWDTSDSPGIGLWWALLGDSPAAGEILAERLKEAPTDLLWRRMDMDRADEPRRAALCARFEGQARQAPDDADLRYLSVRCLPEGEAKSQAFIEGAQAHPRHLWFAYAASAAHAEQAHWVQAKAGWDFVRQRNAGLAEEVNVDLARLARWQGGLSSTALDRVLKELSPASQELTLHLGLEGGKDSAGPWAPAYAALSSGQLEQVLARAPQPEGAREPRLIRLIGASDTASSAMLQAALRLPVEAGLDARSYWTSLGLALRERQGQEALLALLPTYVAQIGRLDEARLRRFVAALEQRRPPAECTALMQGMPLFMRGQAMTMGAIVYGPKAPMAWRIGAESLLFADERPYFQTR